MKNERGFTLIELLIVVAILGILVGIVAMSVGDLTTTAKKRGMASEHSTVLTSIDTYLTQDITVDGGTIAASTGSGEQPAPNDSNGFTKYLKRATKYYFTWTDLATDPYTLTVTDTTGLSYNGTWQ